VQREETSDGSRRLAKKDLIEKGITKNPHGGLFSHLRKASKKDGETERARKPKGDRKRFASHAAVTKRGRGLKKP